MTAEHPELAFLPASPFELTFPALQRLIERQRELVDALLAATTEMQDIFDRIRVGASNMNATVAELATPEEAERLDHLEISTDSIEDALAALSAYLEPVARATPIGLES